MTYNVIAACQKWIARYLGIYFGKLYIPIGIALGIAIFIDIVSILRDDTDENADEDTADTYNIDIKQNTTTGHNHRADMVTADEANNRQSRHAYKSTSTHKKRLIPYDMVCLLVISLIYLHVLYVSGMPFEWRFPDSKGLEALLDVCVFRSKIGMLASYILYLAVSRIPLMGVYCLVALCAVIAICDIYRHRFMWSLRQMKEKHKRRLEYDKQVAEERQKMEVILRFYKKIKNAEDDFIKSHNTIYDDINNGYNNDFDDDNYQNYNKSTSKSRDDSAQDLDDLINDTLSKISENKSNESESSEQHPQQSQIDQIDNKTTNITNRVNIIIDDDDN